jgi:adenylate cyclase
MNAWIEYSENGRIAVESNCYFGRLASNTVHLRSPSASRRHAHIHIQQADNHVEYWLADLGSTNGTLLNGKRITIPCRLKNGDGIKIGEEEFVFRVEFTALTPMHEATTPATTPVRASQRCWFVMIDIKRFTTLATTLETDVLAQKVGTWLRRSRDAIEGAGGVVDKILGDAVFAYWQHSTSSPAAVAGALGQLVELQQAHDPDFRLVLHHGHATISGGAGGADNLSGSDVIYVFRMEKVAAKLGSDSIVSAAAREALGAHFSTESLGAHPLDGFPGVHDMFKLVTRQTEK